MDNKINKFVIENYLEAKQLLSDLISINTVRKDGDSVYPFGKGINEGQKIIQKYCNKNNIPYVNLDNYIAYSHYGDLNSHIGIWTHLDVVPEGNISKWLSNPFKLIEKNGNLYGRGVLDNKGSIVYGLMLLKFIIENNIKIDKGLRIIYGNDEESNFEDIKYYKQKEILPETSFVLDNMFPVTSIEKGVINFDLKFKSSDNISIKGGVRKNVIAEYCCKLEKDFFSEYCVKPGHASLANGNENAIKKALEDTKNFELNKFNEIINTIKEEKWYLDNSCSINIGTIETKENVINVGIEMRYILNTFSDIQHLIEKIETYFTNYNISFLNIVKPYKFDKELVNFLLKEYNQFFNKNLKANVSGYITYAHSLPNSVSFGPFSDKNNSAHCFNENISEIDFKNNIEFYTRTLIKKLGGR